MQLGALRQTSTASTARPCLHACLRLCGNHSRTRLLRRKALRMFRSAWAEATLAELQTATQQAVERNPQQRGGNDTGCRLCGRCSKRSRLGGNNFRKTYTVQVRAGAGASTSDLSVSQGGGNGASSGGGGGGDGGSGGPVSHQSHDGIIKSAKSGSAPQTEDVILMDVSGELSSKHLSELSKNEDASDTFCVVFVDAQAIYF